MTGDGSPANALLNAEPFSGSWPRAYPQLECLAGFKTEPEDFVVDEKPAFELDGRGEHLYLRLEKRATETRHMAEGLAEVYGVAAVDVGYAGMKDKRAVTRQWFSIHTPLAADLAFEAGYAVLASSRHERKLRRGQLAGNTFEIRLRNVSGEGWQERLGVLAANGAPNYFGPQRFGGDNLERAVSWLPQRRRRSISRFKQGLYLSVVRSFLFNEVLAQRISTDRWQELLAGDVADNGRPTAPLWGRGRSESSLLAAEIETAVLAPYADLCDALEHAGLRQQRRCLVLRPIDLQWQADRGDVRLSFGLGPGCYATSLLLEVFQLDPGQGQVS
jgi:tRNA pseudouridine13 synthase